MSTGEFSQRHERAKSLFERGNEAAMKNNFDYAISMYRDATKLSPENLIYRQALRGVERRKFGNDPAKVGWTIGARLQPLRLKLKTVKTQKKWMEVFEVCEDIFVHNPWDVGASEDLADASEQLGLKPMARWAMESVQGQVGKDADFWRHMAHVYEMNEDWQKAIHSWEKVKELVPHDEDARRKINGLSASATIQRSGLHESIQRATNAPKTHEPTAAELDELKKDQSLSPDERFERQVKENPNRVGTYLEWADHLRQQNKLDEAQKVLSRGLEANPEDEVLPSIYAEVQIARLNRAIEAWVKRVKTHPDDAEAKARLAQLQEKREAYQLSDFRRRVEAQPGDMHLRLQYGIRLLQAGQFDAAIAELQQAKGHASTRVRAFHQLGLAFEAKKLAKLAEKNYQDALKFLDPDDVALSNDIHYHLGLLAESQGNTKAAEEHYNEVAANDFAYKDVATRLANLNNG